MSKRGRSLVLGLIAGGMFVALTVLERRRPLRAVKEAKPLRMARNLAIAGFGALTVTLLEAPVVTSLTEIAHRRRWGLLHAWRLPRAVHIILAVVLLDYTLYIWHVLVHRVPWLWRFHLVHHVDLDLDASTALRFHFGELALSIPWRAAQILGLGVDPASLSIWRSALFLSILFHHSNVELPIGLERIVNRVIVTPRMHGIHHSMIPDETNSNWSSGLTLWDRLHGTLCLGVRQDDVTIGVPAYRHPREVTWRRSLALPFEAQRWWRRLPDDGEPVRERTVTAPTCLLD